MNTTLATRPNILKKDANGQWYSIPEIEVSSFIQMSEAIELAEFLSREWYTANDELNERFGCYMRDDL
jgi:hypothetical protein